MGLLHIGLRARHLLVPRRQPRQILWLAGWQAPTCARQSLRQFSSGNAKMASEHQVAMVQNLAAEAGLSKSDIPAAALETNDGANEFIEMVLKRRPPSEKQLQYAHALAAKKGVKMDTIANRLETEKDASELIAELKRRMVNHSKPGDWLCSACDAHNYASKTQCHICAAPKNPKLVEGQHERRQGDWSCPSCATHNFSWRHTCFKCAAAPWMDHPKESRPGWKPGDWDCACSAHNYARRLTCFKCSAPRPAAEQ